MDSTRSIAEVDREIIQLMETRCVLTRGLPTEPSSAIASFPASFTVEQVLSQYSGQLGGPGELLARAVLNVCRAAGSR